VCDVKMIMVNHFLRGYEWILQCQFPIPVINATTTTRFGNWIGGQEEGKTSDSALKQSIVLQSLIGNQLYRPIIQKSPGKNCPSSRHSIHCQVEGIQLVVGLLH